MKTYAFGIDLGGTTVKMGLFKTSGELVEKWEIPSRTENHGEHLLPDIAGALLDKLAERNIPVSEVEGAGMGVPGAVLRDSYVKPCVNLDQWGGFDVAAEVGRLRRGSRDGEALRLPGEDSERRQRGGPG